MNWREAEECEFAVIGNPISHSLSPQMFRAAFEHHGIKMRYRAIQVPPEEFDEALDHLASTGFLGVNVTVPLKEQAFHWVSESGEMGNRLKAVNTIRFVDSRGINTDWLGFRKTAEGLSGPALVLGSGGTTRAVVVALEELGIETVIWARNLDKARQLVRELKVNARVTDCLETDHFPLVINTTSIAQSGEQIPIEWGGEGVALDVSYGSTLTPFLASARGRTLMDGRKMLVYQGIESFEFWTGIRLEPEPMLEAVGI